LRGYTNANYGLVYSLGYAYDPSGRRIRLRTPSRWARDSIRYAYDADDGALTTVWQDTARIRFTYDLQGRQDRLLIGTAGATGVLEKRWYDDDGMLRKRQRTSAALGSLVSDSIVYDLRDKMVDVHTSSRSIDVGTLAYYN
jgi:uncharacterized protein RhaS with RHS repeats